jgi:hypothetical protein
MPNPSAFPMVEGRDALRHVRCGPGMPEELVRQACLQAHAFGLLQHTLALLVVMPRIGS